ncbi:hypothetical protein MCAL160_0020 [Mycoplasmopsis californica HAZ160_1]|uniref:DUF2179 domain-containing protein n=1 Tax=Mycoplasmopsis californica HAZ160_1 TaxID=1397850 RepID=A0AAT9F7B7_9BACT|nr:DUF2179 domain-containing protein [Mycoplasmopsis californica]BAP00784.1 hypothetical protein MCAL160_0020 [Mycoplasmopsis californica HAZ160_1]BBG40638.1 hypothetical protein MCAL106_0020 [Mycoplasmopsis californica]BBG41233.1 hypothetical protein MCAL106E_0020 [Mycoplasmopsis californica]BBG41826.1 hypothetical protein MCAL106L_0020 [Mycoplasmopsis californica]BBG42420.1 hypothetical protein MCAL160E_0020 [Mycoplasmopsis californica]
MKSQKSQENNSKLYRNIDDDNAHLDIFTQEPDHPVLKKVKRQNTDYTYTRMSNFVLKLSRFYAPMPMWKLATITSLLAVLFGVISVFFVKNPGIYNFGAAAFGQAAARLTNVLLRNNKNITPEIYNIIDHALFWILYIILSIPIFIFGWKKAGKVFTMLTILFLVISSLVSFAIGQIPGNDKFYMFGNFSHSDVPEALKNHITKEYWGNKPQMWSLIPLLWDDAGNVIAQMIFGVVYGFMLAYFFAVIAIIGGSAGVTGIIGEYMSVVKQKNFGTINGYINLGILVVAVLFGSYLPGSLLINGFTSQINPEQIEGWATMSAYEQGQITEAIANMKKVAWSPAMYLSPNFISTLFSNFVFVAALNKLFPRFKIVQCKVYSPHMSAIKAAIIGDQKTINSFTVTVGEGGYSGSKTKVLSSITLYKQVPRLIKKIRAVDKDALITVSNVASVDGKLYIPGGKF